MINFYYSLALSAYLCPHKASNHATVNADRQGKRNRYPSAFFGRVKRESLYRLTDEYSLFYLKFIETMRREGAEVWKTFQQKAGLPCLERH